MMYSDKYEGLPEDNCAQLRVTDERELQDLLQEMNIDCPCISLPEHF